MTERLIISGFGGQGIMFMGKLLAEAALLCGKEVTFLPAYGAEVRGGTSHCNVIISDEPIFSPCIVCADSLIVMNEPSLNKFLPFVRKEGHIFINISMVGGCPKLKGANIYWHKYSDMALKLGDIRTANMIAVGAYLSKRKIVPSEQIVKIMPQLFGGNASLIRQNKEALAAGEQLCRHA